MNVQQSCPVNYKRVNAYLIKFYSTIVAALLMMFLLVDWRIPLYILAVDFGIRVLAGIRFSPLCLLLNAALKWMRVKPREIDASTKQFAAKVGLLFSWTVALLLITGQVLAAKIVATVFLLAVLSEVMLDFCMACWMENQWKRRFGSRRPERNAGENLFDN